jgi:hypothetical protein
MLPFPKNKFTQSERHRGARRSWRDDGQEDERRVEIEDCRVTRVRCACGPSARTGDPHGTLKCTQFDDLHSSLGALKRDHTLSTLYNSILEYQLKNANNKLQQAEQVRQTSNNQYCPECVPLQWISPVSPQVAQPAGLLTKTELLQFR